MYNHKKHNYYPMKYSNIIPFVSACSLFSLSSTSLTAKETNQKPVNFLLIVADDCSYYDIGCFGAENNKTPNIDKLADEGLKFNRAYNSASMSTPTRHSLYTGIFPMKHGGYANHSAVKSDIKSMPHYLSKLGYRVGLAGKWHIRPVENFPFEKVPGFKENCVSKDPSHTNEGINEFMSRDKSESFCLVLASINPHMPSTGGDPSIYDRSKLILPPYFIDTKETRESYARYLAEVTLLDDEVGDAVRILKAHNLYDNTVIIFVSEQGSQFAGGKWTNWGAGVKSAMIAKWTGVVETGSETNAIVQYEDILPTFIDIARGKKSKEIDGKSFLKVLNGKKDVHRKYAYHVHNNVPEGPPYPIKSISDGKYRLIWNLTPDKKYVEKHIEKANWYLSWKKENTAEAKFVFNRYKTRPELEFYDIENDPIEFKNLIEDPKYKNTISRLKKELVSWMKSQGDLGAEMDK